MTKAVMFLFAVICLALFFFGKARAEPRRVNGPATSAASERGRMKLQAITAQLFRSLLFRLRS
jgi:hypothetical protein